MFDQMFGKSVELDLETIDTIPTSSPSEKIEFNFDTIEPKSLDNKEPEFDWAEFEGLNNDGSNKGDKIEFDFS